MLSLKTLGKFVNEIKQFETNHRLFSVLTSHEVQFFYDFLIKSVKFLLLSNAPDRHYENSLILSAAISLDASFFSREQRRI